jgi:hypothetical protein
MKPQLPTTLPATFDADFLHQGPYEREAFLLDEMLELDAERGMALCRMRTDRPNLPLVRSTRPLPGVGDHHIPGGVLVHLTGNLGLLQNYYFAGCRYRDRWIGYGVRIHDAEVLEPVRLGPPLLLRVETIHNRTSQRRHVTRYHFEFHQESRLVYRGDQTAIFQRIEPGEPLPGLGEVGAAERPRRAAPSAPGPPLAPEFLRSAPYTPAGLLIKEILEAAPGLLRARMSTADREQLPFAHFQRDPYGIHPAHVTGGALYHLSQVLAVLYGHYVEGPSYAAGAWIRAFKVHRAEYRGLAALGPPLEFTVRRISTAPAAADDTAEIRLRCEYHQQERLVYRSEQTACWQPRREH